MKIGILGGAFNPVHREHVNLARAAVRELELDKIIIMPTAVSPHKSGKLAADFWQRYEMCRLAFASVPQAEISNFELTRGGVSYTYLTCEHFAGLYKDAKRWFIIGADMLENFPQWKSPEKILEHFSLAACARENQSGFAESKARVESLFSTEVAAIPYVGEKVSSTEIRTLAALGEDFDRYVNAAVGQYIRDNALYYLPELQGYKKLLTPERSAHTVRVAVMCAKNAARANLTESQAVTMAALHDCGKYLPTDSPLLKGFTPPKEVPPPVLHQYTGAYVAEKRFGVCDKTILSAIACHTTGKENMSDADALLYLCDMLEDGRKFEGVDALRKIFKSDLKECLFAALSHQIDYLKSTGEPVDEETLRAYNYIKASH
ncbi:MAG: nicotinate (nicotinamide) nucleotide adenylyltransferase [Clostridiales bacterium]|nr:nicotinate (nicotinamide) nucleotide adenylyltransferase [Clostridiales bacterium]